MSVALVGAIITASVAVIVALATQIWTSQRARTDRRYTARRAAIIEAQDAGLELRDALDQFGRGLRPGGSPVGTEAVKPPAQLLAADSSPSAEPPADATAKSPVAKVADPGPTLKSQRQRATGRFEVCVSRVHDAAIVTAMKTWQSAASRRFISTEEVTAGIEDEWFRYVQELCRLALVSDDGSTTKKSRAELTAPEPLVESPSEPT